MRENLTSGLMRGGWRGPCLTQSPTLQICTLIFAKVGVASSSLPEVR
jgi:hypothetical protein